VVDCVNGRIIPLLVLAEMVSESLNVFVFCQAVPDLSARRIVDMSGLEK
jgi:hypothetical protein